MISNNEHFRPPEPPPEPPPSRRGMPLKTPPHNEPHKPPSTYAIDSRSIRNCVGKYTYVWMKDGSSFWIYPTHVGRKSLSGYRYGRRYGWVYFGTDLNNIESFYCSPW